MKYQPILLCCLLSFVVQLAFAQKDIQIKKIDFRGQRAQKAFVAAHSASKKDVVVVMLRGADQDLIEQTEQNMKGLIQSGYERIGLVISDLLPEDKSPTIAIMSQGYTYASIKEATISAKTNLHFYQLMRDVYKEDILSKLD
ncbi:MAG: hypothetical protein AAGG68_23510 [Bacteroidota bacterium]